MSSHPPESRIDPQAISRMFGEIADRYDLMNRVMTMGQDGRWRRQAAGVAELHPGETALDVAAGTGDLAFELAERVGSQGRVIAVDFSEEMLNLGRRKAGERHVEVSFQLGDVLSLPFPDDSFDAVTCAFGLRNFADREEALRQMVRVVRPGRRVVILELTPPKNALARGYMDHVVPRLGQLIAQARPAYSYLPQSAHAFPDAMTLGRMMQAAGLRGVTYRLLNVGTVALHWGEREARSEK